MTNDFVGVVLGGGQEAMEVTTTMPLAGNLIHDSTT